MRFPPGSFSRAVYGGERKGSVPGAYDPPRGWHLELSSLICSPRISKAIRIKLVSGELMHSVACS